MDEYINIGRWFSVLHRRSQIFVVEACEKLHLTYSEYVMLLRIYDHEGARQDELAAMLYRYCGSPAASRMRATSALSTST